MANIIKKGRNSNSLLITNMGYLLLIIALCLIATYFPFTKIFLIWGLIGWQIYCIISCILAFFICKQSYNQIRITAEEQVLYIKARASFVHSAASAYPSYKMLYLDIIRDIFEIAIIAYFLHPVPAIMAAISHTAAWVFYNYLVNLYKNPKPS